MFSMRREIECRDDGFSVVEIVVAAAVLFFVLTAVLGLVATSTNMSLSAKQRTTMVNTMSSHMEWVRSLTFDELDIAGTTGDAVVDSERVVTVEGYTITITTQITDGRSGTKEVHVIAVATAPGRSPLTMESFTAVWDSESGLTATGSSADAPIIEFGIMTPDADEVVYGAYVLGGAPLYVDADVSSPLDDGLIVDLSFYCSGFLLRNGNSIFADVAAWTPNEQTVYKWLQWDTRQVDDDGNPAAIEDGWRTVRIIAHDSEGTESVLDRRFYVDNRAPDLPGIPSAQVYDNVESRLSWDVAQDGTDPAQKYEVTLQQVVSADGTLVDLGQTIVTEAVFLHNGSPFSRYNVQVRAGSPRNLYSDYVTLDHPYVTRPSATGVSNTVYSGSNNSRVSDTAVSISCDTPNFPVTSATYDVFRSMDPNNMGSTPYATNVGSTFTESINKLVRKFGTPDPWYYQFRVNYVASGYRGLSASAYSNIIGPTTALTASVPMEHMQW